jgi:pimeloyl-ACP methyl ester carboxylesterase
MADADTALGRLGRATLLGRGLGAYVALLLAGARPKPVRGAILCDGPGLAGGGSRPGSPTVIVPWLASRGEGATPDPFAQAELARDLRPPDYATSFLRQATQLSGLARPISVCVEPDDAMRLAPPARRARSRTEGPGTGPRRSRRRAPDRPLPVRRPEGRNLRAEGGQGRAGRSWARTLKGSGERILASVLRSLEHGRAASRRRTE